MELYYEDKNWLRKKYWKEKMSLAEIAELCNVNYQTIHYAMKRHKIRRRNRRQANLIRFSKYPPVINKGENSGTWNGGVYHHSGGYIYIKKPNHPHAPVNGYVAEHRLVMEKHIGRYLKPKEIVHHKDGNKKNNTINNLQLLTRGQHLRGYKDGYNAGFASAFLIFLMLKNHEKGK